MAAKKAKSKSTKKVNTAAKKTSRPIKKSAPSHGKKQAWAVILFALGLFTFFVTLIRGENVWSLMHDILFGIFSFASFLIAPILIYVAVMITLDRPFGSVKGKMLQGLALMCLICGAIQIFSVGTVEGQTFFDCVAGLYEQGVLLNGGGLAAMFIGWPLMALFGNVCAGIAIVILAFVFIMLLSGITLKDFFHGVAKPVKKMEETYARQVEEKQQRREPKFNIDVDLGPDVEPEPLPEHPVQVMQTQPDKKNQAKIDALLKAFGGGEQAENKGGENIAEPPVEENREKTEEKNTEDAMPQQLNEGAVKTQDGVYRFPPLSLLTKPAKEKEEKDVTQELKENAEKLVDTLKSFGVSTRIVDICRGPAVTRYELQPAAGVKISRITGLADDIALNLAAAGVRIEAPIPNKPAVGIEVPNKTVSMVNISQIIGSPTFRNAKSKLTFSLGRDIAGNIAVADIGKMPHVLIAGATGSGKSVCINSIIMSLLYKASPNDVRLLMIDPKVVELGVYNGIPHLLVPVVTDPRKAAGALSWAVSEMLNRYRLFADANVRDLNGYNEAAKNNEEMNMLPQIVIIIDELADLMMAAPNEVEDAICRLAQMARAAGMHLVIATQRPSVDVITGVIKANIPSRIAFAVSSQVDSRTILDGSGAEKLLGRGDMLFYPVGEAKPVRIQGCYVSDKEVEKVIEFIKNTENTEYDEQIMEEIEKMKAPEKGKKAESSEDSMGGDEDPMLSKAIEVVVETGQASTSLLQRKLKLGYARAARIVDMMEEKGVVGPFEGSKPRKVLMSKQQFIEMRMNTQDKIEETEDALL